MKYRLLLFASCTIVLLGVTNAQKSARGWHLLDENTDHYYGISLTNAYNFLSNKKYKTVIVAVIDSGVDTTHEDLKNVLWHNPKEIPGNGIDDDGNGYVDDVYGWNFLGNRNGNNLKKDIDERTRVYYRFKNQFAGKAIDEDTMNTAEKEQYRIWQKAANEINANSEDQLEAVLLDVTLKSLLKHDKVLQEEMNEKEYSVDDLEKFEPSTQEGKQAKLRYITCMKLLGVDNDMTNTTLISELKEELDGKKTTIDAKTKTPPDYRAQIIKDDYYNINDKYYGNGDVMGPSPMHGTHVSGIIAAQRNNGIGCDGIADHVKIMMVRAIPDGDEYDKDVALAIKYAVDNGASVINMSFGKSFSPEKNWVDEAVHYAESKDVLIVHAAGNESEDIDKKDNYPNPDLVEFKSEADNFITVGASGDPHVANGKLIANFSNYGAKNVDVFAPGVKIYSTLPGGNSYGFLQGTSMAAPVVTGIAALIRSYYPQLSAHQVKYAIEHSTQPCSDSLELIKPGTNDLISMRQLCTSGGFVNAYAALQIADSLKPEVPKEIIPQTPKSSFKNLKINR